MGRMDEAIDRLEQALRLNPKNLLALNNLALALRSKGRLDESIERYRQALGIAPNSTALHANIGLPRSRAWPAGRGHRPLAARHQRRRQPSVRPRRSRPVLAREGSGGRRPRLHAASRQARAPRTARPGVISSRCYSREGGVRKQSTCSSNSCSRRTIPRAPLEGGSPSTGMMLPVPTSWPRPGPARTIAARRGGASRHAPPGTRLAAPPT